MELFAKATKIGLTFPSPKGVLGLVQVWELPLKATGFDLDKLSQLVIKEVEDTGSKSLVSSPSEASEEAQMRLEVLKFIIQDKQEEKQKRTEAAMTRKRIQELQEQIHEEETQKDRERPLEEKKAELERLLNK